MFNASQFRPINPRKPLLPGAGMAAGTALILLAAGCGGATAAPAASGASSSAAAVRILTVAAPTTTENLDPDQFVGTGHTEYVGQVTSTLVRYKPQPAGSKALPGPADLTGELAKSWTPAADGITFVLRAAKSPAGNTVTSDDIKYSFERAVSVQDPATTFFLKTAGVDLTNPVTVIDPTTVKVNAKVNSTTLPLLAFFQPGMLDSTEVKKHVTPDDPLAKKWLSANTASFAAYQLDSIQPGKELDLKANPNYWAGQPYFTQVHIRAIPDSSSGLQLLESGQVEWARFLNASDHAGLKGKSGFQSPIQGTGEQHTLHLDIYHNKAFENAKVRQAISMAIDRNALVQGPYQNIGAVPVGSWSQFIPQQQPLPQAFPFDVAKAKALLAEAGYASSGLSLQAIFTPGTIGPANTQSVWVLLQSQLKAAGIDVQLKAEPSPTQTQSDEVKHNADMFIINPGAFVNDAGYIASQLYTTDAYNNKAYVGYSNATVDTMVPQALTMPLGPDRDALLAKVNATLRDDSAPLMPLIDELAYESFKSGICGYSPSFGGYAIVFQDLKAC